MDHEYGIDPSHMYNLTGSHAVNWSRESKLSRTERNSEVMSHPEPCGNKPVRNLITISLLRKQLYSANVNSSLTDVFNPRQSRSQVCIWVGGHTECAFTICWLFLPWGIRSTRQTLKQMNYSDRRLDWTPPLSIKNRKLRPQIIFAHQNWTAEDWKKKNRCLVWWISISTATFGW